MYKTISNITKQRIVANNLSKEVKWKNLMYSIQKKAGKEEQKLDGTNTKQPDDRFNPNYIT